ncbi:MAG: ATP-binding domain-containing protein, partial [Actinomycetia bacterium]|nr:ATP-binding domain-containing protein [Actinomycetes bacterium]
PTITAYADDEAEADGIAQRVREAHSVAGSWSDQAVLVRTNAQLLQIEQALREAAVPTRLRGNAGPLNTPEVRAQLNRLSQLEINFVSAVTELEGELSESIEGLSVADIERRANLGAFVRLVGDYVAIDNNPTGPGLAAWMATLGAGDIDADTDAVELTTFHGAKGLEWPVVHVAGLEEGFVPIAYASTGAQLAEERRLLYVAITRAEEELSLSWAAARTFTSRPIKRQASPHLAPLAAAIDRLGVGRAQRVDWRAKLEQSRRQLDEATSASASSATDRPARGRGRHRSTGGPKPISDPTDEAVYQALQSWRQRRARAADVPPYVVFDDRTLRAIASARPASKAGLAAMP